MTLVQLAAFEAAMATRPGRTYRMLFKVLGEAGLRPGEGRALRVDDVDWVTGTLHVVRAFRKDGQVKETKTKRTRDVEVSTGLLAELREYVTWLRKRSLAEA